MVTINDRDVSHRLYEELQKNVPHLFVSKHDFKYILDPAMILDYEQKTGETVGVLYKKSQYEIYVVDLVETCGKRTLRGRIIIPFGGVIIIPKVGDRYILEDQYRCSTCRNHLAFPRGHGEPNAAPVQDAIREIREEVGGELKNPVEIGRTYPETNVSSWYGTVFAGEVEGLSIGADGIVKRDGYEGIQNLVACTAEEINALIAEGKIDCGYTLAAWALYQARQE